MITVLKKYALWRILFTFLKYPTTELHINKIAKLSGTSTMTAKMYVDILENEGIISIKRTGNMRLAKLAKNFATTELKKFYAMLTALEIRKKSKGETIMFGSFPEGKYDEKSDIDLFTTGDCDLDFLDGFPINTIKKSKVEWINMIKDNHPLVNEIKRGWKLHD